MPLKKAFCCFLPSLLLLINCADEYVPVDKEDMSPLYVVNTVPANGAVGVERDLAPNNAVVINFSKTLDEKFVNEEFFDFTCNGVKPESKINLSEDKKTVSIRLKQGVILPERAFCRVVVSKLIRDSVGLPFYLSENSISSSLLQTDGGLLTDTSQNTPKDLYKDKRTGEGDYILEFTTIYEPLRIKSVFPEDGAKISPDQFSSFQHIVVSFNKAINAESVNISNFIISGEYYELTLSEDKKDVVIKLAEGLKEGRKYNLTVMPFVSDESGILLGETYSFSFETKLIRAEVISINPADGFVGVNPKLKSIRIEFNKDINPATINENTIVLTNVEKYSVRYDNRVAYIENFLLKEKSDYRVIVTSQIEDMSGFTLEKTYCSNFRTAFDTPYVKTIFPALGAKNVPSNLQSIDIEFSEDMDFRNIDISMFQIRPEVNFSVVVIDSKTVKLNLHETLVSGNSYNVKVKNHFMDLSGIKMEKDFESYFTVSSLPDNNPPSEIVIYSKDILVPQDDKRKGFVIEWRAPASDIINGEMTGKVKSYALAYSETPFDKKDFSKMTELANLPTPSNPGDIQNIILYSLIDKENNEKPIIYNKPYYFMLKATDGTNFVYSNLLSAGILAERVKIHQGTKYSGLSMKYIQNFNKEDVFAIGDTDDSQNGKVIGSVGIFRLANGGLEELFRIYGKSENSLFGYQVESVDINNDSCQDLVVSAPLDGTEREGAIYIYVQSKNGSDCIFTPAEPIRISGGTKDSMFGLSMYKFILNNKEHLIVGAPAYGELNTGAAFIYMNRDNVSEIPQSGDQIILGQVSGSSFGHSVFADDLNQDGCGDIVISSPDALPKSKGSVYVLFSSTSVSGCLIQNTDISNANLRIDGDNDYERLGYNLLTADLNGDLVPELIMSGRDERDNRGLILIRNSSNGNILQIQGETGGNFGFYMKAASDFRKDGCKGGVNTKCRDLFVSDEKLSKLYLLEGREDISGYTFNDLVVFGDKSNPTSFGYSFTVFMEGIYENLLVASPFVRNFDDYISEFYIYK